MPKIRSKIRGLTYPDPSTGEPRQTVVKKFVRPGMKLIPIYEPDNPHGSNAIGLWLYRPLPDGKTVQHHLGYIGSDLSSTVGPILRSGQPMTITVTEITGGNKEQPTRGVNILIEYEDEPASVAGEPSHVAVAAEEAPKKKINWGKPAIIVIGVLAVLCAICGILALLFGEAGMPLVEMLVN